jgi:hypothetical protein
MFIINNALFNNTLFNTTQGLVLVFVFVKASELVKNV